MSSTKKAKKLKQVSCDDAGALERMPGKSPSGSSMSSEASPNLGANSLSRQQRNLAEKNRRDKLNNYISELANLVPFVSRSSKKLDKTSILRLSAAHLRLHNSPLNSKKFKKFSWKPDELDTYHLSEIFKAIDGFLIVASQLGKIIFTSKSSESYLGLQDIEMIGHSLFSFIHPADVNHVKEKVENMVTSAQSKNSETRCNFCARMRERSQPRSEVVTYQMMHFNCRFDLYKESDCESKETAPNSKPKKSQAGSAICSGLLKIFLKPMNINPVDELTITEAFQEEYITKHGIDGKILFADHRISTITGHLPHEVIGMLAYDYIFPEDVPVAHFAQKLMFSSSNGMGMIVYRLKARDCTSVFLKTIGHLQYDKGSTTVSHFVCINKLLSEEEGEEELRKFTDRYSPHIKDILALAHSNNFCDTEHNESHSASSSRSSFSPQAESSTLSCLSSPCAKRLSLPSLDDYPVDGIGAATFSLDDNSPSSAPSNGSVKKVAETQNELVVNHPYMELITCQACVGSLTVNTVSKSSVNNSISTIKEGSLKYPYSKTYNGHSQLSVNGRKRSVPAMHCEDVPFENGVFVSKRPCCNLPSAELEGGGIKLSPSHFSAMNRPGFPDMKILQAAKPVNGQGVQRCDPLPQVNVTSLCQGISSTITAQYAAAISHNSPHSCSCSDHYTCHACQSSASPGLSPQCYISDDARTIGSSCNEWANSNGWLLNYLNDNHDGGLL